jgi:riboflavin synthase
VARSRGVRIVWAVFTGIVREIGTVAQRETTESGERLTVEAPDAAARTALGDSVAVAGVCLTAVAVNGETLAFDVVPETLARTTLGALEPGAPVNIEPAMLAGEPLGGHIVQGHIDGVGRVRELEPQGEGARLTVELPADTARLSVDKGSIALDGVSLTIAAFGPGWVEIALVPHTLEATTLGRLKPGDGVNVEADVMAKHVERLLQARGERG